VTVEIVPLPVWRGGLLAAEYDAAHDCVRINNVAIERVRTRLGPGAADAFVRCALEHERFHRAHPHATEAQAHEHVRLACGYDPRRFEAALRA
jgi:hypothetical protein